MTQRIAVAISLLFNLLFLLNSANAQLRWPEEDQVTRPWTRWWWLGSDVDSANLELSIRQLSKAGIGGVEITAIYGVEGEEAHFRQFLSPSWIRMLSYTLEQAKQNNMGVDLANGTGWPFGGPDVTNADASKTIYFKRYSLDSGQLLTEKIKYDQKTVLRTANQAPPVDFIY